MLASYFTHACELFAQKPYADFVIASLPAMDSVYDKRGLNWSLAKETTVSWGCLDAESLLVQGWLFRF